MYVLKIVLPDDCVIHKIGMVNSPRSTDRMMEILRSWHSRYRFVPYCELRLDMECHHPRRLEEHVHKILAPNQFIPNEKVSGGTEMFIDIDEFRLIQYIKAFNDSNLDNPLDLTPQDYSHLHRLLVPNG